MLPQRMLGYKKDEKKDALFSSHEASYLKEEASVRYRTFLCRDIPPAEKINVIPVAKILLREILFYKNIFSLKLKSLYKNKK
jgi:hypothetical protein